VIATTASIYPGYFLSFWFGLVGVWRDSWLYNSFRFGGSRVWETLWMYGENIKSNIGAVARLSRGIDAFLAGE